MAKLLTVLVLLLLPVLGFGQIELGEYRLCFKKYWTCHTQLRLELSAGNLYKFVYSDDTRTASSTGSYEIYLDKIVLTPHVIPDTIKISFNERDITKTTKARFADEDGLRIGRRHVISATKDYKPFANHDIEIFSARNFVAKTNSNGDAAFKGQTPDSIKLSLHSRVFTFYPKRSDRKNLYQIWIQTDFKDVALASTCNGVIQIVHGQMYLLEWNEDTQQNDKVYFRKI